MKLYHVPERRERETFDEDLNTFTLAFDPAVWAPRLCFDCLIIHEHQ